MQMRNLAFRGLRLPRLGAMSGFSPASLPSTRLFDGLYQRPEILFSSLAPLTPLRDNGTDKVALAIDTSQGANVIADGTARTFTGLGADGLASFGAWTVETGSGISGSNGTVTLTGAGDGAQVSAGITTGSTKIDVTVSGLSGEILIKDGSTTIATIDANGTTESFARIGADLRVEASGTTTATVTITAKPVSGIHGIQTTANDQPSYDWDNFTLDLPGATQHLTYPNASLGDDVTAMMLVKIPASVDGGMLVAAIKKFSLYFLEDSTRTDLSFQTGAPTYSLNGVAKTWTRGQAHAQICTDEWVIVGIHGIDCTYSEWRTLILTGRGDDTGYEIEGSVKASFFAQSPSLADRNQAGNYLASLIPDLEYTDET
jgi:hypothetical protein